MTGISFSNLHHEVLQAYGACKNEHIYMHALVIITLVSCPSETNTHKTSLFSISLIFTETVFHWKPIPAWWLDFDSEYAVKH